MENIMHPFKNIVSTSNVFRYEDGTSLVLTNHENGLVTEEHFSSRGLLNKIVRRMNGDLGSYTGFSPAIEEWDDDCNQTLEEYYYPCGNIRSRKELTFTLNWLNQIRPCYKTIYYNEKGQVHNINGAAVEYVETVVGGEKFGNMADYTNFYMKEYWIDGKCYMLQDWLKTVKSL
jgi:hypothetical protein